jgi:cytochrome-b5 reductase
VDTSRSILQSCDWDMQVHYVVDKPVSGWRGGVGYISKDMVLKGLPCPSEETLILVRF